MYIFIKRIGLKNKVVNVHTRLKLLHGTVLTDVLCWKQFHS